MQLLNMYQYDQLIKEPTHISEHSSTTIDLAFTNDAEKIIKSGVLQCSISDHSLIFLTRRAKNYEAPAKIFNTETSNATQVKTLLLICMRPLGRKLTPV